jgi:YVTN family beta-propeller protein
VTIGITSIRRIIGLASFAVGAAILLALSTTAQTQRPTLLVVSKAQNSLGIFDPQTRKILATIPTGKRPHQVAISADGTLAFVTNQNSDSISVIDLAARKELRRLELGPGSRPHGVIVAGGKLYFTADGYKLVGCYDLAKNQIDWLLGTGQDAHSGMLVITKDGNKIFMTNNDSDTVTVLEHVSDLPEWKVTTIPVGKVPHGIDMTPDGKEVWVSQEDDGSVTIIDVASLKVIETVNVQTKEANSLRFTPDGKLVLITDRRGEEVFIVDATTRKVIKRLKAPSTPTAVMVVPDGSQAYVANSSSNNVAVIDLKTLEVTGHISTGAQCEGLAWIEAK